MLTTTTTTTNNPKIFDLKFRLFLEKGVKASMPNIAMT